MKSLAVFILGFAGTSMAADTGCSSPPNYAGTMIITSACKVGGMAAGAETRRLFRNVAVSRAISAMTSHRIPARRSSASDSLCPAPCRFRARIS